MWSVMIMYALSPETNYVPRRQRSWRPGFSIITDIGHLIEIGADFLQ
jgi:hypothetical protein